MMYEARVLQLSISDEALLTQLSAAAVLTPQQTDYTRQVTHSLGKTSVEVLRLLRLASDNQIAQALAKMHGLPNWQPDVLQVESAALAKLPFSFARQHHMLPVRLRNGVLLVATDEPGDIPALQRLRRHVQGEVRWIVAPRAGLVAAIEMAYRAVNHPSAEELARELKRVGNELDGGLLVRLALADGVERGASDVHFTPSGFALLVSFRIDGVLQLQHVLPAGLHVRVASAIKVEAGMDIGESRCPQDGSYTLTVAGQPFDLRVSSMPTTHGENLVVRILSMRGDVLPLDQCGFWPEQVAQIEQLMRAPDGLVLVTGPTGCGKTTTLYAGLRMINALERNIMTVEDPVEYHVPLVRQVRLNDRAGMSFASAVKGFLRQDPDVMLVGEIRDAETASMAIRAAQTGHLVPSSLHTNDAVGAISRLRDLGIQDHLLSASLRGVVAQRLVRKLCTACRQPTEAARFKAVGCPSCNQTGYRSRSAVGEVLMITDALRTLIDQQAGESAIRRCALAGNFKPMRISAQQLVDAGVTDGAELDRVFGEVPT